MKEFVVFDENGVEVDWVDPVLSHRVETIALDVVHINNGYNEYRVVVPEGGRWEIRDINHRTE